MACKGGLHSCRLGESLLTKPAVSCTVSIGVGLWRPEKTVSLKHIFMQIKILCEISLNSPLSHFSVLCYSHFFFFSVVLVSDNHWLGLSVEWIGVVKQNSWKSKEWGKLKANGMALFSVWHQPNSLKPSSPESANPTLSQCPQFPLWDPCFLWELVFSRHLSKIQLKPPHHKEKEPLKVRVGD